MSATEIVESAILTPVANLINIYNLNLKPNVVLT